MEQPYSIDKLMHETRTLAAKYRQTTGSTLPITGEIARFDAAKALNLSLINDPANPIEALGLEGERQDKRFIIKGRTIFDETKASPRVGQINTEQNFDAVLLVLFDESYETNEIYEAMREDIIEALNKQKDSNRKKRGGMSVAQFKIIGHLVWNRDDGVTEEIWDNH